MPTIDIKNTQSKAEIAAETAGMLGASPLGLPPLTAGRLAILEMIESPFVVGGKEPNALDTVRALYVLAVGASAVAPAMRATRAIAAIIADNGGGDDATRLAAIANAAERYADFDVAALAWLDQSGVASVDDAAAMLVDHFRAAVSGFNLIPSGGDLKKKNVAKSPNGWRRWPGVVARSCRQFAGMIFCGKFRS